MTKISLKILREKVINMIEEEFYARLYVYETLNLTLPTFHYNMRI